MARLENIFKKYLVGLMGTRWDVQSHEDQFSDGIPDLSYGIQGKSGWIELKQIDAWPKMTGTLLKPKKFTPEQVNWLRRRGKRAGNCFVFVKVAGSDYFMFNWVHARLVRQGLTRADYCRLCVAKWHGSIDPNSLAEFLSTWREVLYDPSVESSEHGSNETPLG